jgi:hypothetical protein
MRILFNTISSVLLVLLAASLVHAGEAYIPYDDRPIWADFIIVGTVVDKSTRWSDIRKIMVMTDYTVQVEENIKGHNPGRIVISLSGGTVEGEGGVYVTDIPVLKVGERYVLFVYDKERHFGAIVGAYQGVFHVVHDIMEGEDFIVDYHWNQVENLGGLFRSGPRVELAPNGELVVVPQVKTPRPGAPEEPVIWTWRDSEGNVIPRPEKPEVTVELEPAKPLKAVTKSEFIAFIKKMLKRDDERVKKIEELKNK